MSELHTLILFLFAGWTGWKLGKLRSEIQTLREACQARFESDSKSISRLEQEVERLKEGKVA